MALLRPDIPDAYDHGVDEALRAYMACDEGRRPWLSTALAHEPSRHVEAMLVIRAELSRVRAARWDRQHEQMRQKHGNR